MSNMLKDAPASKLKLLIVVAAWNGEEEEGKSVECLASLCAGNHPPTLLSELRKSSQMKKCVRACVCACVV